MLVSDEGRKPMPVSLDAAPPDKQPSFDQAIDGGAIGPLQLRVFVLCAMALFAEGFDAHRMLVFRWIWGRINEFS